MSSHHIAVRIHSPGQVGSKFDGQGADSAVSLRLRLDPQGDPAELEPGMTVSLSR
jgi:hypothetical protein